MSFNQPVPYPETWLTVWSKSLGILAIGIASVVVSCSSLRVQQSVAEVQRSLAEAQKMSANEDLELRHRSFDYQRETDEARLAAAVMPALKCNDDLQRNAALELLVQSAPSHAASVGALVLQKCSALSRQNRLDVTRLQAASRNQKDTNDFVTRINNARDYHSRGFDPGRAAHLFEEASKRIPESLRSRINTEELSNARGALVRGEFSAAADHFELAFRQVPEFP